MSDSEIVYNKDGSLAALHGEDATKLMRIFIIKQGIEMHLQTNGGMILTRNATITKLLTMAGNYTGKKYKRTEKQQAIDNLQKLFDTLKLSLPPRYLK